MVIGFRNCRVIHLAYKEIGLGQRLSCVKSEGVKPLTRTKKKNPPDVSQCRSCKDLQNYSNTVVSIHSETTVLIVVPANCSSTSCSFIAVAL